jgi:hypothetical protein
MLKPDFWRWSAARAEIDQRAREARLGLERLESLLELRVLPTRSGPRQVLHRRGLRFFRGGCVQTRSTKAAPPGPQRHQVRHIPTETCVTVTRLSDIGGTPRPRRPA